MNFFPSSVPASQPVNESKEKKTFNCHACTARIPAPDKDPHTNCFVCRGQVCDLNLRCIVCQDWSSDKMSSVVKYHKSLERKRISKRKLKGKGCVDQGDFSVLCTVGEGEDGSSGVEGSELGDTAPGSTPRSVDNLDSKLALLTTNWDNKFAEFKSELGAELVGYFDDLSARIDSISNRSLPAPHQVAVDQSLGRDRLTTLHGGPVRIKSMRGEHWGRWPGGLPIISPPLNPIS